MSEVWKPISEYAGLYEVSDMGHVRRVAKYNNSSDRPLAGQLVCGYPRVSLSKEGKVKNKFIHVLVAQAFIGIAAGMCVNHKNGVRTDNRLSNLEVVTRKENERHKWDVLKTGASNKAKLNYFEAEMIRLLRKEGWTYRQLADRYSVSTGNIGHILSGATWRA